MRKIEDSGGESTPEEEIAGCIFCSRERAAAAVAVQGSAFALEDLYPVTEEHLLVIPRRHTPDFFTMTDAEKGRLPGVD